MRLNVYTEELLDYTQLGQAEIVTAEYVSSRTGEQMKNWGLRIHFKSHPDLHHIPGRDDDRSAVTFWCGPKEKNIGKFLQDLTDAYNAGTLKTWHDKTEKVQAEAERRVPRYPPETGAA